MEFEVYKIGSIYQVDKLQMHVIGYDKTCSGFDSNGHNKCENPECLGRAIFKDAFGYIRTECGHSRNSNFFALTRKTNCRW